MGNLVYFIEDMSTLPSLESRLARAEAALSALARELAAIRADLNAAPPAEEWRPVEDAPPPPRPEPPPPPPRPREMPRPRPRREARLDFERLIGRYGMLGIAVLA